jgi:hypothetical protein
MDVIENQFHKGGDRSAICLATKVRASATLRRELTVFMEARKG